MRLSGISVWLLIVLGTAGPFAGPAAAQDGTNVLLVVNDASPDSRQIGEHYAAVRGVPRENIVRLQTPPVEEVERRLYDSDIEFPILRRITSTARQDRILYIVLTKDVPLRIRGTAGLRGTTASVDSELTLLYQRLLGHRLLPFGRLNNPYFHGDRPTSDIQPFSHATQGMYLVTRLDGFTVADVLQLIDRGAAPARDGVFVLDQRSELKSSIGNAWLVQAAERLTSAGLAERVVLDTSAKVVSGRKPVLGYFSWGSNDPSVKQRRFDFGFAPGALAGMFVSTDARTFKEPPATWSIGNWSDPRRFFAGSPQSLTGDLIREGATGVSGHVAEPYLDATVRPQILFPAYVSGLNLAEAYYLAMPYLSWQNIIIGDPLCAPFRSKNLPSEEQAPALDPETELPRFFSARRLEVLHGFGVRPAIAKLVLKASAQLSRGDIQNARPSLEEVTRLEPNLNAAHFVLAGLYDRAGDYDLAIDRYRKILTTAPEEVRSLNNLAYLLAVQKHAPGEALPLADKAYRIAYDQNANVDLDLGASLLAGKGTPVGAMPFSLDAYDMFAMKAQISDTVGWIHHLLGNDVVAEPFLLEASTGAPFSAEVQLHLATVQSALDQHDLAITSLERAIALDASLVERDDVRKLRESLRRQSPAAPGSRR